MTRIVRRHSERPGRLLVIVAIMDWCQRLGYMHALVGTEPVAYGCLYVPLSKSAEIHALLGVELVADWSHLQEGFVAQLRVLALLRALILASVVKRAVCMAVSVVLVGTKFPQVLLLHSC